MARVRAGTKQATLNIELALSTKQNITATAGASSAGSGPTSGGTIIGDAAGGGGGTGGGGGGFIYCFSGRTPVRISGGYVPIFAVPCGIEVISPDEEGKLREGKVVGRTEKYYDSYLEIIFADGRRTEVRPGHKYRNEHGVYIPIEDAEYSMHMKIGSTKWTKVAITDKLEHTVEIPKLFYNLEVDTYHSYMANDDWVSNRKAEADF
jgi:hypothetical protein